MNLGLLVNLYMYLFYAARNIDRNSRVVAVHEYESAINYTLIQGLRK